VKIPGLDSSGARTRVVVPPLRMAERGSGGEDKHAERGSGREHNNESGARGRGETIRAAKSIFGMFLGRISLTTDNRQRRWFLRFPPPQPDMYPPLILVGCSTA
jgi:hypothetical protein